MHLWLKIEYIQILQRNTQKKKLCIIALFGERTKYLQIALAIFYLDWVRCCILTFDPRVRVERRPEAEANAVRMIA